VSYNPPRYETDYNFYVEMQIANNPYFDHIRIRINDSTVTLETRGGSSVSFLGMNFNSGAVNVGSPREQQRYEAYTAMCREIEETVQRSRNTTPQEVPAAEPVVEQVPAGPKFCPNCGAPAEGGKFCQSCGSQL
ncbi:MAG: zinc ribbon domain-containing protein, partial [Oscillospiraceae bacterium]|nr:zinc ribbon domain-containing protein [Oscillospiraceae bacterium]